MTLFLYYPKCSTCQKAKKYLEEKKINFQKRDMTLEIPSEEELTKWIQRSGLPTLKFFNTSGLFYKKMNLKEKLKEMSNEEQIKLLSTNGMLIKRPLLITEDKVLVGFKESEYEKV